MPRGVYNRQAKGTRSKGMRYSDALKAQVKDAIEKGGKTVKEIAKEFGPSVFIIKDWKKAWGLTRHRKTAPHTARAKAPHVARAKARVNGSDIDAELHEHICGQIRKLASTLAPHRAPIDIQAAKRIGALASMLERLSTMM